jgi:ribonuclease H2 subunit A
MAAEKKEVEVEELPQLQLDLDAFLSDTSRSCSVQSSVPEWAKTEECCLGIDEAGRGPVLGPMVYGTCFCAVSKTEDVKQTGVADSKVLSEEKREELFRCIDSSSHLLGWKVEILSPNDISNCMLRRTKYNLNALSHDTAINLIRKVMADGVKLSEVYVDTVGDPGKYQAKLTELFPQLSITVAKKADSLFPIVSAASICAKVFRDECLKRWKFIERDVTWDCQFGCGYPSDPQTKDWLTRNLDPVFGFPAIVRFSWSTCAQLLEQSAVDCEWPDDDEDKVSASCAKISQFFAPKTAEPPRKRHRYFEERGLQTFTGL